MSVIVSKETIFKNSHDVRTNNRIWFHKQTWIIGRGQQTNRQNLQHTR